MTRKRILVVEDEDLIRTMLLEALEEEGFLVVAACTGDAAVMLIDTTENFDAVVTDIHMPGKCNGIAVVRYARRSRPTIPAIYCTGRPDVLQNTSLSEFWDVLLPKPYVPSQVIVALRRLLPR